jgi:hypothetical protein
MNTRTQAHKRHVKVLADAAHLAVEDARKRFPRHETKLVYVPAPSRVVDESWHYRDEAGR